MSPRKKPVTLEQIFDKLTGHDKQFAKVFDKLTDHDKQFEKVFDKLAKHDVQFERITSRLLNFEASVGKNFEILGKRITAIETEEKPIKQIEKLQQEYQAITVALKRIETNLDLRKSDEMGKDSSNIKKRMTNLERRVQVLETK